MQRVRSSSSSSSSRSKTMEYGYGVLGISPLNHGSLRAVPDPAECRCCRPPLNLSSSTSSAASSSLSSFASSCYPSSLDSSSSSSSPVPSNLPSSSSSSHLSLSSLRDLAVTASTTDSPSSPHPLSPSRPTSPDSLPATSSSGTRPIPIPKRRLPAFDDLPVTPLTGRFDKGYYFPHTLRPTSSPKTKGRRHHASRAGRPLRMRSDHPTFCSPVTSPTMSPSGRPDPHHQSHRSPNSSKSVPTFHLGSLPRFHPAVYQSPGSAQAFAGQPPSPRLSKQNNYRPGSRESTRQYRELIESTMVSRTPPGTLSPGPSAPRLDPLRSPGPVTPLVLEEGSSYLAAGNSSEQSARNQQQSGPGQDLVEMLVARENERARQMAKISATGR